MRRSWEQWRVILAEYEDSGESHAVFARSRGLNVSTFRRWLYLDRNLRGAPAPVASGGRFVECVQAESVERVGANGGCVVRLGHTGMVEVTFASAPPADWLCAVARGMAS